MNTLSAIPLGASLADERFRQSLEMAKAVGHLVAIAVAALKAEKDADLQSEQSESYESFQQQQDVDDRRDE